jgi:hypothetical protein
MNIEDLIQLLDNRLREFKLSRDYAVMNGDLGRMNTADKEVIALEDTLYKLNLLIDTSKSAAVKKATLAEVITDGSVAVLGEYDITPYATDPKHEEKIMNILSKMGVMDTVEKIDDYIKGKYLSSPVTGEMIMNATEAYDVDTRLMMAIMEQDSRFGTVGVAVRTLNPGNVGNTDDGSTRTYDSWQEGVTAVAEWLNRHRGSTIIPEIPEEIVAEPIATTTPNTATTTPPTIMPTSTTTPSIATSTLITATSTPITFTPTQVTATSTPVTATTTPPVTATSTPTDTSATPVTATSTSSTLNTATTTPPIITSTATSTPVIITSTPSTDTSTTTDTSTPVTATSTPSVDISTTTIATTTPSIDTSTTTDTSTPVTATSTPSVDTSTTTTTATTTPSTDTSTPVTATTTPTTN